MAAILDATTPLGIVIIGNWVPEGERITWMSIGGVITGLVGVAVLVGPTAFSAQTSPLYLWGVALVLLGALSYSVGALSASRLLTGLPTLQPAIGQNAMGALILAPFAAIALTVHPQHTITMPFGWAIASALALALGGTSLAYLCYYWLIERVGPTRTLLVTYLLPCTALVYGAIFLQRTGEHQRSRRIGLWCWREIFLTGRKAHKNRRKLSKFRCINRKYRDGHTPVKGYPSQYFLMSVFLKLHQCVVIRAILLPPDSANQIFPSKNGVIPVGALD